MSESNIKNLYRRWLLEMWHGELTLARELVSADFLIHQARVDAVESESIRGPEAIQSMIEMGGAPFDDLRFSIDVGPLCDDDKVVARWTGRGRYRGGMPGATAEPGTEVVFSGIDILRVESGRFVEYWVCSDGVHLMAQLGLLPSE